MKKQTQMKNILDACEKASFCPHFDSRSMNKVIFLSLRDTFSNIKMCLFSPICFTTTRSTTERSESEKENKELNLVVPLAERQTCKLNFYWLPLVAQIQSFIIVFALW